jgi:hypothetical protein
MTVDRMLFSIKVCITVMIVTMLIPVFEGTIACNGALKNFGMVMMRYQIVSQKN